MCCSCLFIAQALILFDKNLYINDNFAGRKWFPSPLKCKPNEDWRRDQVKFCVNNEKYIKREIQLLKTSCIRQNDAKLNVVARVTSEELQYTLLMRQKGKKTRCVKIKSSVLTMYRLSEGMLVDKEDWSWRWEK